MNYFDEPIDSFREDIENGYIYEIGNVDLYNEYNRILEYEDIILLGESFYYSLINKERELKFLKGVNRKDIIEYIYDILTLEELNIIFDKDISKIENLKEIFLYNEDLDTEISRQEGISIFTKAYELYKYKKNLDAKGILYKIEKDAKELYILGTIHAGDKTIYPFSKKIKDIINKSDIVSVEANIIEDISGAGYLMEEGTIEEGELKDFISGEAYIKLKNSLEEIDDDIENYIYSKPWFVAMLLEGIKVKDADIDPSAGIDYVIMNKFINDNKEIVELEGIKYQVDLFSNMDRETQESFLLNSVESIGSDDEKIENYLESWRIGDSKKFETLIIDAEEDMGDEIQDILLKKRNKNIIEKINNYFKEDKIYLVLVGTGHLFGRDGLLKELEKNYHIEQIL